MHKTSRLLSRIEAAVLLRDRFNIPCCKQTLANWAHVRKGPAYHLVCRRALYREEDLIAWAQAQIGSPLPRREAGESINEPRLTAHP